MVYEHHSRLLTPVSSSDVVGLDLFSRKARGWSMVTAVRQPDDAEQCFGK